MAQAYKKSLTLAESQSGTADSTDWVLTVAPGCGPQSVDADFKTTGNSGYVNNANGYDIRFYSDSALTTALTYELVYFNAATGAFEAYVKIPTLSTSTDTVIYVGFGDTGISTDGSSNTTWDSNFELVAHLKDGSTLSVTDSSQSGNNGTNSGSTAATGKIGGAASYNGSSDYTDFGVSGMTVRSAGTIEGWFKTTASLGKIVSRWDDAGPLNWLNQSGTSGINVYYQQSNNYVWSVSTTGMTSGTWTYIAFSSSAGGDITLYKNDDTPATGSSLFESNVSAATKVVLGAGQNGAGHNDYAAGQTDEIRVSSVVRSTSWLLATYNSQKDSSTFITWGARTSMGGGVVKTLNNTAIAGIKTIENTAVAGVKTKEGTAYQ